MDDDTVLRIRLFKKKNIVVLWLRTPSLCYRAYISSTALQISVLCSCNFALRMGCYRGDIIVDVSSLKHVLTGCRDRMTMWLMSVYKELNRNED